MHAERKEVSKFLGGVNLDEIYMIISCYNIQNKLKSFKDFKVWLMCVGGWREKDERFKILRVCGGLFFNFMGAITAIYLNSLQRYTEALLYNHF